MPSVQQYWKEVRQIEATLAEYVWLAQTVGGFLTQVTAAIAARRLQAKSHRLATPEEVAAYEAESAAQAKSATRETKRRAGSAVVVVDEPTAEPVRRRRR
jgi:conjugal transfer/entry exclusion protein